LPKLKTILISPYHLVTNSSINFYNTKLALQLKLLSLMEYI
jgi:hypothetical protein